MNAPTSTDVRHAVLSYDAMFGTTHCRMKFWGPVWNGTKWACIMACSHHPAREVEFEALDEREARCIVLTAQEFADGRIQHRPTNQAMPMNQVSH